METLGSRRLPDQFSWTAARRKDAFYQRNTAMNLLCGGFAFVPFDPKEVISRHERIIKSGQAAHAMNPAAAAAISPCWRCAPSSHQPGSSPDRPEDGRPSHHFRRGTRHTHSHSSLRIQLPGAWQYRWEESERKNALWWDGGIMNTRSGVSVLS